MRISVDYGYDIHSLEITASDWSKINAGEEVTVTGQGFPVEGEMEQDYWSFNFGQKGSFGIDCDSGRQVYDGSIGELTFD